MTQVPRSSLNTSLLAYLLAAPGLAGVVKTAADHLLHWKDLQHLGKCPALLVPHAEDSDPAGTWGKPNAWHLTFNVRLYTYTGRVDGSAGHQLDALIDAIDAALEPEKLSHRQTLGGAVWDCRISGKVESDGGVLGGQATALIPVTIRNL